MVSNLQRHRTRSESVPNGPWNFQATLLKSTPSKVQKKLILTPKILHSIPYIVIYVYFHVLNQALTLEECLEVILRESDSARIWRVALCVKSAGEGQALFMTNQESPSRQEGPAGKVILPRRPARPAVGAATRFGRVYSRRIRCVR